MSFDTTVHPTTRAVTLERQLELRLADLANVHCVNARLGEAIRYSLLAPGKRLRPLLCVYVAQGAGQRETAAIEAGCAIEMVHTASLLFDDLPSMDNAELRRGQACTHRVYGEATAMLASIALMNRAFEILSTLPGVAADVRARCCQVLSEAVGPKGLCGGQQRDLEVDGSADAADMDELNHLKTGLLFMACVEIGGVVAGLGDADLRALRGFARHLGAAFQIADDIQDLVSTPEAMGKDRGKDAHRPTLVATAGLDGARRRVQDELRISRTQLERCHIDPEPLRRIVSQLEASLPA